MINIERGKDITKLGFVVIKGYKRYAIDKNGNIISLVYNTKSKFYINVSTFIEKNGYIRVKLVDDKNHRKNLLVHRLVAETFIPNPNNYPEINHKDYNRKNNSVDNLEWCTKNYNSKYSAEHHSFDNPNKIKIKRINTINDEVTVFKSMSDTVKDSHITFTTLYKSLNNKDYITKNMYKFEYADF